MDFARGLSERGARHREASKDEADDKDAPVHQSGMTATPISRIGTSVRVGGRSLADAEMAALVEQGFTR